MSYKHRTIHMYNADAVVGSLPLAKIAMHLLSGFPKTAEVDRDKGYICSRSKPHN